MHWFHDLMRVWVALLMMTGSAVAWDGRAAASDGSAPRAGPTTPGADHGQTAENIQNPLANTILLPFQTITDYGFDPGGGVQSTLNIQPIVPVRIGAKWDLLLRPILPVISNSWPVHDSGVGDLEFEPFLSPVGTGPVQWGVGAVFSFPTASKDALGFGKYTAGPAFALFAVKGDLTFSLIATQQWSYAGNHDRNDVSLLDLQPSLNYNLSNGWYLICGPQIIANWEAGPGEKWIVPIGGGVGKIISIGKRKFSLSLENYWNVVHPDNGPRSTAILTFTAIFSK